MNKPGTASDSAGLPLRRRVLKLAAGLPWLVHAQLQGRAQARPAAPQTWALLVAVARVAALPRRLWLRGPDNDVQLMHQALLEQGVAATHITRLSAAAGDAPATHANVHAALQALLALAQPGDQVVLHLAGHGVQVPQRPGATMEPDGLDEAFLCSDTQAWDSPRRLLPQALYDDDIGDWMDAVVARGARVLAVFDTCHASGLQRDRRGPTRLRGVAAAELGVPTVRAVDAPQRLVPGRIASAQGRVLAFAARSHEGTPEEWLPKGSTLARVHGVFTYAVTQALREGATDAVALRESIARQYHGAQRAHPVPTVLGQGGWTLRQGQAGG